MKQDAIFASQHSGRVLRTLTGESLRSKGFTFVELLITMTILGIVATLFLSNFQPSLKRARDTERKSDLAQYRIALENYATANNNLYPGAATQNIASGICDSTLKPDYLASCPDDKGPTKHYKYWSDRFDYTLWAQLNSGNFWVVCSNGKLGETGSEPSGACNL